MASWSTGGDVVLASPQRHVLRLLALTGRDHAFLIHASVQAAAAGLPGRGAAFTALKETFEKRDDHWIAKRDSRD